MVWLALFACSVPRHRCPVSGDATSMFHGFGVAYLADQNDVRSLAQGVFQCVMPGMRIDADFAMGDQRLLRSMHELDGIFHGE